MFSPLLFASVVTAGLGYAAAVTFAPHSVGTSLLGDDWVMVANARWAVAGYVLVKAVEIPGVVLARSITSSKFLLLGRRIGAAIALAGIPLLIIAANDGSTSLATALTIVSAAGAVIWIFPLSWRVSKNALEQD